MTNDIKVNIILDMMRDSVQLLLGEVLCIILKSECEFVSLLIRISNPWIEDIIKL